MSDFWYWINERHRIYIKKEAGLPRPWTDDPILQKYKFTNAFRELDRTTKWMRHRWDHPDASIAEQLFNICFFRVFGTMEFAGAHGWVKEWKPERTKALARERLQNKQKVFTGAYIITNQGLSEPKEQVVADYFLTPIWENRESIALEVVVHNSLKVAHQILGQYQGWGGGGFMAYEAVTDFNHTFLTTASDRFLWANAGPGAKRGLNYIHHRPPEGDGQRHDYNQEMQMLLREAGDKLERHIPWDMVDMRMIEHSLCEYWKYKKVELGLGTPRSLYRSAA